MAQSKPGCTPGHRDANNDGKTPVDFLREANELIRERRDAGHGVTMPDECAYLTIDEVLGIRL